VNEAGAWSLPPPPKDALAEVLARALTAHGHPASADALTEALPATPDGKLTPALAVRAAEARGIRAALLRRRLDDIAANCLPAILFLDNREVALLSAHLPDGRLRVIWPARGEGALDLPQDTVAQAYSGHALLLSGLDVDFAPDDATGGAQTPKPAGHWFWSALGRHASVYGQVVLASAAINLLALAVPLFTMNAYDRVFPNNSIVTLWSLVAGVGVALIFDFWLKFLRARILEDVGGRVDRDVSARLFRHVAHLRSAAAAPPAGETATLLRDFDQVRDVFSSQTVATLTDLAFALLFVGVIAYIGGPLAWPPTIALAFALVSGLVLVVPLRRAARAAQTSGAAKHAVAVETVSEPETLRSVGGASRMQSRWERSVAASAAAQSGNRRVAALAVALTGFAQQAASVGIVVLGVYLALDGRITMGAVIATMILSGRALAPAAALSGLLVRGSFALSAMRSIDRLLDMPSDATRQADETLVRARRAALSLSGVALSYDPATAPALSGVDLAIAEGERIGVLGGVGVGKSSLLRVLSGNCPASDGRVLIDGLHAGQQPPGSLRDLIQYVPQEAVLFTGTLAENIAFGMPGASDSEILAAARAVGVDRVAASHPEGFGMAVAERGRNLSGGQRQLVAIARGLIRRPRLLVLDEPTSAMDPATERLLLGRLAAWLRAHGAGLVIATHRRAPLQLVDRIVLLDGGRIVRDGPKPEVLAAFDKSAAGVV